MKSTPTVETLYKKLEEVVERFEDTYDSKGLYSPSNSCIKKLIKQ